MSPAAERLQRVVMGLVPAELEAVIAFVFGLREQAEHVADELRSELSILVRGLPAQAVHALVQAARALAGLVGVS